MASVVTKPVSMTKAAKGKSGSEGWLATAVVVKLIQMVADEEQF